MENTKTTKGKMESASRRVLVWDLPTRLFHSTLTTFGGLAPMIFETSRQARFLIPMAISLGFGILFAALITLLLVPALYMINEDLHQLIGQEANYKTPYDLKTHQ